MAKKSKKEEFDFKTIKTFEDACARLGIEPKLPDVSGIIEDLKKPLIAGYKLMVIFKAINDGWKPNWGNWDENKYFPWYGCLSSGFGFSDSGCGYTNAYSGVGSRLCTNSSEKALYIAKQFEKEYQEYFLYSE